MQNLVSIILPVYNVENYIENCLNSIISQSYFHFEVIIVNDGSTDNSMSYCEKIVCEDLRFRIINKDNGGLSDARNVGLEAAKGDYIIFVDSDDFISPNLVSHLMACLENYEADLAICDPVHFYLGGNQETHEKNIFKKHSNIHLLTNEEAICELFYQKTFLVSAWGKVYKKSIFDNIRFPKGKLFEDSAVMHLLFEKSNKIVYSNAKLYAYVHRKDSITTSQFSERDLDILDITDQILKRYKSFPKIYQAAISYKISACFRVILNAPNIEKYTPIVAECKKYVYYHWKDILFNKKTRIKTKLALISIVLFKPFIK
ncbi:TPA: glycosyltransferase, partial [Streptococcus agalactiae]|nr:glycosyltransferase [Streptococcus agalactiae]